MLTWRLRRALNNPLRPRAVPDRAFLQLARHYRRGKPEVGSGFPRRSLWFSITRSAGMLLLPIAAILFGAPIFIVSLFLVVTLSPVLVPLLNTLYGLALTLSISGRIAREHQAGRYDLLGTLPTGIVGLHWSFTLSGMLQNRLLHDLAILMSVIGIISSIFAIAALFGANAAFSFFHWLIATAAAGIVILLDNYAAQVTAGLLSMTVPAHTTSTANARFITAAVFILLQLTGYLLLLLVLLVIVPASFQLFGISDALSALTLPLAALVVLGSFRELTIRLLWRRLPAALNATSVELERLC
ncbi:MAG: hypothetical protein IAE80_17390 [Anaerolinea sp.]|nr:hypothetical protein [Anaerolinea sp.]